MLPQFIIPGAQKCGTTTLNNALKEHPDCYMYSKDSNFFCRSENLDSIEGYEKHFDQNKNQKTKVVGEACGSYYWNPNVPSRIKNILGSDTLILMVLRNPVRRAISSYYHQVQSNREFREIETVFDVSDSQDKIVREEREGVLRALQNEKVRLKSDDNELENPKRRFLYLRNSFYHKFIRNFVDVFDQSQVKIVFLETLKDNPVEFFKQVAEFLNIDEGYIPDNLSMAHNKTQPRSNFILSSMRILKPMIPESIRQIKYLRMLYDRMHKNASLGEPPTVRSNLRGIFSDEPRAIKEIIDVSIPDEWDVGRE